MNFGRPSSISASPSLLGRRGSRYIAPRSSVSKPSKHWRSCHQRISTFPSSGRSEYQQRAKLPEGGNLSELFFGGPSKLQPTMAKITARPLAVDDGRTRCNRSTDRCPGRRIRISHENQQHTQKLSPSTAPGAAIGRGGTASHAHHEKDCLVAPCDIGPPPAPTRFYLD